MFQLLGYQVQLSGSEFPIYGEKELRNWLCQYSTVCDQNKRTQNTVQPGEGHWIYRPIVTE